MTQLMQQRPWAVWCLFLAGAITGGVTSSLMEPQHVRAELTDLNGQPFEVLRDELAAAKDDLAAVKDELSAVKQLTGGISRDESGVLVFRVPVKIELLDELEDTAALSVLGPVKIELLDELKAAPAVSVRGRVKIELLDENPENPVLAVRGPVALANTLGDTTIVANDPSSNFALQVHVPGDDLTGRAAEFVGDMHLFGSETIVLPEEHPGPALDAFGSTPWTERSSDAVLVRFGGPTVWTGPDPNLSARVAADELFMVNSALDLGASLNATELLIRSSETDLGRLGVVDPETGETELIVDDAIIRNAGPF